MSPEVALQTFKNEVYTAAEEKAWENREPNQFALLDAKAKYAKDIKNRNSRGKSNEEDVLPSDFTVNAQLDASGAYNKGVEDYVSNQFLKELDKNPLAKQKYSEMNMKNFIKGNGQYVSMFDIPEIAAIYDNVKNSRSDVKTMFIDSFNDAAIDGKLTTQSINSATNNILRRYGSVITDTQVSKALQMQLPNKE